MSVLTNMLDQREGWAERQKAVFRRSWTRAVLENALLVAIGLVIYNHSDAAMGLIRTLLR